ncbi:MAG: hypothetical protein ABIT96_12130 [Ferruginibacter sp.]
MNISLFNGIDFIVFPLVLLLIIFSLRRLKKKQPENIQKYFFNAFFLRVLGTFSIAVIYEFVYGYGDTYGFFMNVKAMHALMTDNFGSWVTVLFSDPRSKNADVQTYLNLVENMNAIAALVYQSVENANLCKVASVFNLVCFNSYLSIALFFGTFSFIGCWYVFKTFTKIFPGYEKQFAWLCLYIPSLWFWGSGLLKDPLCIFAIGILLYNAYASDKSLIARAFYMFFGLVILYNLKGYIFYVFTISFSIVLVSHFYKKLQIGGKVVFGFFVLAGLAITIGPIASAVQKGFLSLVDQSKVFFDSYTSGAEVGDSTVIYNFDPSPLGFFRMSIQGLITVYMRPFPWEFRKLVYLFVIMENLLMYYLLFKKFKIGPVVFTKNNRKVVQFCLYFTLLMGIVIGITTFNLGAIARYRVPALAFLFSGIFAWKLNKRKAAVEKENEILLHANNLEIVETIKQ